MRILSLISISALLLSSCSNFSTTTVNRGRVPKMHLEAGGFSVLSPGDTAINFDLVFNEGVTNYSAISQHLYADWELVGGSIVGLSRGTIDLGMFVGNETHSADSTAILVLRPSTAPVTCNVLIRSLDGSYRDSTTNFSLDVPFQKRWHGIVYTVESSPTELGILDGPDDGDWPASSSFTAYPPYPNPFPDHGETIMQFSTTVHLDSVRAEILITPHHSTWLLTTLHYPPGTYSEQIGMNKKPGLYRVLWHAYNGSQEYQSHGDIIIAEF